MAKLNAQRFALGAGAGVDSVWEQKKLEARKMLENAAESPASSARFVGRRCCLFMSLLPYIFPTFRNMI